MVGTLPPRPSGCTALYSGLPRLRGRAEPVLAGAQNLEGKLQGAVKSVERTKAEGTTLKAQLATSAEKLTASDAAITQLSEHKLALESQVSAAQARVAELEKKLAASMASADAAKAEVAALKKKNKETVKEVRDAFMATDKAIKAQVKLLAPEFDVSAVGAFKTIKDGKIVDLSKKCVICTLSLCFLFGSL
ncbi:uncharacterized protein [Arachis hypogaea]|uniref:uncharacterized protein n=1 Tax=Arachis hypogaea TaxID=3818 RepID=UPI003B217F59